MYSIDRSSRRRCSMKTGALEIFSKFIGKHLYWSLFLTKLLVVRLGTLPNSDSSKDVFLRILKIFYRHLFCKTSSMRGCFCLDYVDQSNQ